MVHGIKVSKPGYNVLTTGDANISFSSQLATHSIYNIATVVKPSGGYSVTYTHSLGYVPKVWVFVDNGTFLQRIPAIVEDPPYDYDVVDFYITNSSIVFETSRNTYTHTFKVIIFTRSPNP